MRKYKNFTAQDLEKESIVVLRALGREAGVKAPAALNKEDLIDQIIKIKDGVINPVERNKKGAPPKIKGIDLSKFYDDEVEDIPQRDASVYKFSDSEKVDALITAEGLFEQVPNNGYGFLRSAQAEGFIGDIYVSQQIIKKYNLKTGDKVKASAKPVKDGSPAISEVIAINDVNPELYQEGVKFDLLTPFYPTDRLKLENGENSNDLAIRCIDLFAPIGMGQRGLIVAPPKTGKTTLLKKIARSIEENYPSVKLIMLLIGERPEEVTDIKRSIKGEVVFSTFDEHDQHHIRVSELVIHRAKRLVEVGENVVILMDSITRLARAYNNAVESSGKVLSGGLDPAALHGPKRFFGAARNIENGGSLTILATALTDTGSRMDDVVYEEFKGTGNMEIHLSRLLSEKRVFPAIDLAKSGTRREDLLLNEKELATAYKLRKILESDENATDNLLEMMKKTKNNLDLSDKIDVWMDIYKK